MSRVVEIDEAIRRAGDWLDIQITIAALSGMSPKALAGCETAADEFHALRAARARGETHVTVEDE